MKNRLLVTAGLIAASASTAYAQDAAAPVGSTFSLGEVTVTAPVPAGVALGGSVITQEDIRTFRRDTLDTAIQLIPGATVSEVGPRNETDIWLRGFDRWRVPLYI